MALGGVATGSMKAKEAAITQGNIKYKGFKLSRRAKFARIGRMSVVVAELLVTSVSIAIINVSRRFMAHGGMLLNTSNCSPMNADNPDFSHASARANPPPINNKTPHGNFFSTVGQSKIAGTDLRGRLSPGKGFFLRKQRTAGRSDGKENNDRTIKRAAAESPTNLKKSKY